jgi:polyhydroxyalkanoate synthase subunit PhaC
MPTLAPRHILARIQRDTERSVLRARNGIKHFAGIDHAQVGRTPKDVVWRSDKVELWHYHNDHVTHRTPILLVMSLVTRSYILDLYPGNSVVEALRDAGFDVFMVDWGIPDQHEADHTLEHYVDGYLPPAARRVLEESGAEDLTMLGYCFGGVLALLLAAAHPEVPLRHLVTMATPVDFSRLGFLTAMTAEKRLDIADYIDETGNVPADSVRQTFRLLKPTADLQQYASLWQNLWNDQYMEGFQAMGRWVNDHVPFPGAAARQSVDMLMRRNAFMTEGALRLDDQPISLKDITCSVLNVVAEKDHICPVPAAEPLVHLVGSDDAHELRLDAGHAGLVAGRKAAKVTLPHIIAWLAERNEQVER